MDDERGTRMIDPLPFMTYAFVMSITPGPNNVMLTAGGANFGFRRTLPHMTGICIGVAIQLLATCAGLGALFDRWPALQLTLGWAGAAYLVFLGWQLLRSQHVQVREGARPVSLLEAVGFQFLNPKAWVMTITAAAVFLPREFGLVARNAYMVGITEAIGIPCLVVWALFGSSLRALLATPRNRRIFNVSMALALAATALAMVAK
jgi:threonine/homoserine/homoserine lactone efflux protein